MDKQIEEIAKELCPHYDNGNCYYEYTEVCDCRCGCEFCWAVSQVLNAGYRKIPEGAVVLTREEAEQVYGTVKAHGELLKDLKEAKSVFEEEMKKTQKEFVKRLEEYEKEIRKETAEKFAERLKELEEALLDMVV